MAYHTAHVQSREEAEQTMSFSFTFDSVIRGHHIYKDIWTPSVGEILSCKPESGNIHDLYAVAVHRRDRDNITTDSDCIVGHVSRSISAVCCLFLRRGTITCEVTGLRQHSFDLPQGGLEVPCCLTFNGSEEDVGKVKKLLELAPKEVTAESVELSVPNQSLPSKRPKLDKTITVTVDDDTDADSAIDVAEKWVILKDGPSCYLTVLDKTILMSGGLLTDIHMTAAQQLLLHQFPNTKGLQNILCLTRSQVKIDHGLQVVHDRNNHWVLASNFQRKDNTVEIYDSVYSSVNAKTRNIVKNLFQPISGKNPRVQLIKTQKQVGSHDCGLFAVAMATAILNGHDPKTIRFHQQSMREHLIQCFEKQLITPFPTEII